MNTALNPSQTPVNNFDGRIVNSEHSGATGVEAILNPGDVITATEPLGGNWGGAPIMAKIDLADEGTLTVVKIDIDNPEVRASWSGQIPFDKYEGMMGGHSLVTAWTPKGRNEPDYFTDVMAGAGIHLPGRDDIKGGKQGTKFYRWGDNEMRTDRERTPVTLENIPEEFVNLTRNVDGSVTVSALRGTKDVKVNVMASKEHEEVIGEKWANEIEAARKPVSRKLAGIAGKLTSKLVNSSYRRG